MKINPIRIGRERQRGHACRLLPELLTRAGLVADNASRLPVPDELGKHPPLVTDIEFGHVAGQLRQLVIGQRHDQAIGDNDLLGGPGILVNTDGLPCHRIDLLQRGYEATGDVDPVADSHQAAGQLGRATLERPQMVVPFPDLALPQDNPVKSIPCDELPVRRRLDRGSRSLIHDVDEAAVG